MAALEAKLEAAGLPPEASKVAKRDLSRLKRMQASQPEYTVRACVRSLPNPLCPVSCARVHATAVGKPGGGDGSDPALAGSLGCAPVVPKSVNVLYVALHDDSCS